MRQNVTGDITQTSDVRVCMQNELQMQIQLICRTDVAYAADRYLILRPYIFPYNNISQLININDFVSSFVYVQIVYSIV